MPHGDKRKPSHEDLHGNLNIFKNGKFGLIPNISERLFNSIRKINWAYVDGRKRKNPIKPNFRKGNASMKKTNLEEERKPSGFDM